VRRPASDTPGGLYLAEAAGKRLEIHRRDVLVAHEKHFVIEEGPMKSGKQLVRSCRVRQGNVPDVGTERAGCFLNLHRGILRAGNGPILHQ
jgi:hypothetical protein